MAIFRSKSSNKAPQKVDDIQIKISSQDEQQYKMHSANVHDPILSAVQEAQPFEQAAHNGAEGDPDARRPSYLSQDSHDLKDILDNLLYKQICLILQEIEMNVL